MKKTEELFKERIKRFNDAVELKLPDRIPIAFFTTFFPAKYIGFTPQEVMYDYDKLVSATKKAVLDFDADIYTNPFGIPKGKAIYWFERTDMYLAKKILGGNVCIMGLMPSTILCTGSTQAVKEYCKKLIDVVGKDGGYILTGDVGIPDEARPENVKAMIDFARGYGVY